MTETPDREAQAPVPGFTEALETAFLGIVDRAAFRRAGARPAPALGVSAALAFCSGGAALAVNLSHATITDSRFLGAFSPLVLAAVGAAALGVYAAFMLLLSVLLYGIGNGAGGKGDFDRGLQAAAMLSVLIPVQMLCSWFSYAWLLPSLLAGWAAAGALEGLFDARPVPVRVLCALLTASVLGLQFVGRTLVSRAQDAYAQAQMMTSASQAMMSLSAAAASVPGAPVETGPNAAVPGAPPAPSAAAPAASGLDLLRAGPSDDSAAPAQPESGTAAPSSPGAAPYSVGPAGIAPQMDALQANAAAMIASVAPMLEALSRNRNMPPERRKDILELKRLVTDLQAQLASGKPLDNETFTKNMARYQQLMVRLMAAAPPPSQAPAPREPR